MGRMEKVNKLIKQVIREATTLGDIYLRILGAATLRILGEGDKVVGKLLEDQYIPATMEDLIVHAASIEFYNMMNFIEPMFTVINDLTETPPRDPLGIHSPDTDDTASTETSYQAYGVYVSHMIQIERKLKNDDSFA